MTIKTKKILYHSHFSNQKTKGSIMENQNTFYIAKKYMAIHAYINCSIIDELVDECKKNTISERGFEESGLSFPFESKVLKLDNETHSKVNAKLGDVKSIKIRYCYIENNILTIKSLDENRPRELINIDLSIKLTPQEIVKGA